MKKFLLFLVSVFTCTLAIAGVADQPIRFNQLPQPARQFIKKHFPGYKVVKAETDDRTYEVNLSGGVQIEFNRKGHWTEIEGNKTGIPNSVLPERVLRKVSAKYPGTVKVLEVEREGEEIKVKLSNGREMEIKRLSGKKYKNFDDDDEND